MISYSEPGPIYLPRLLFLHSVAVKAFLVIVFYHPLIYVIQFNFVSARQVDLFSLVCLGVSLVWMFCFVLQAPWAFSFNPTADFEVFHFLLFYTISFFIIQIH